MTVELNVLLGGFYLEAKFEDENVNKARTDAARTSSKTTLRRKGKGLEYLPHES